VEISGHTPIPLAQKRGVQIGSFTMVFWVLNFQACFEAVNDVFWGVTVTKC
jgi:hypothetical protein